MCMNSEDTLWSVKKNSHAGCPHTTTSQLAFHTRDKEDDTGRISQRKVDLQSNENFPCVNERENV